MIRKRAKGKRPVYLDSPEVDQLLAIVLSLAGEVAVLRERLDTVEQLLQEKGMVQHDEIEAYLPDQLTQQEREQWRRDYLARLLRVVDAEVDDLK